MENKSKKPKNVVNKKKQKKDKSKDVGVSVITCTNRIDYMNNIFNNYNRQSYNKKELIIILNKNSLKYKEWYKKAKKYKNIRVFKLDEKFTFPQCKNIAIKKAKYDYITHFDDDDYYGEDFLKSSVIAFNYTNADIIGKRAAYVYFEESNVLALRFPDSEYKYVDYVLDSSMVIKRKVFDKVKFPKLTRGADFQFQMKCRKKGLKIFSTDRHNYLFIRRKSKEEHNWKMEDKDLLKECKVLKKTHSYEKYVSQKRDWNSLYKKNISFEDNNKPKSINFDNETNTESHGISVITCTNRQNYIDNVFKNFTRQNFKDKELIIILNSNDMNQKEWEEKAKKHENIRIFQLDEELSLGKCLNFGVEKARFNCIAKFDDDDYYGPKYLTDSLNVLLDAGADIVGKAAYHVYFKKSKTLAIRMPNEENSWVDFVNGPTLLFKKDIFKKVSFKDITKGEDVAFCKDCISNGFKIYSGNRFHHVYIRHTNEDSHTYVLDDEEFLKCCVIIAEGIENYRHYADSKK